MNRCTICGDWLWGTRHTCSPAWHVMPADYGDDETPATEHAPDARQAAERHLERHFRDYDYPRTMELKVRPAGGGDWEVFIVDVESQPVFTARRKRR